MIRPSHVPGMRSGFTLVELLVAIAIMAILLAILGVAVQKATDGQRVRSSKEQLGKLQKSLDAEYDRVLKQHSDEKQIPQAFRNYSAGDPNRALAVWKAFKLRQHFPESFAEALRPIPIPDPSSGSVYYTLNSLSHFSGLVGLGSAASPPAPHPDESAVLLYIILTKVSASGGGAMSAAGDDLSSAMMKRITIGGREFDTFADSWGNSIAFRRWYGSNPGEDEVQAPPYLGAANTFNPANLDPFDPRNLILGWNDARATELAREVSFNGRNRTATVISRGKNLADPSDDLYGFRLRKYGN